MTMILGHMAKNMGILSTLIVPAGDNQLMASYPRKSDQLGSTWYLPEMNLRSS